MTLHAAAERYAETGMVRNRSPADGRTMTLGGEIKLLDDVAASLRAMASNAVAYDDDVVRWLADQVKQAANHTQELADAKAAMAFLARKPD